MTDNQALWDLDAQKVNALYLKPLNAHRAAIGLAPVDNVRDHVFTERPWLAVDPVLGPWQQLTNLDLVQTGAWILPDERPLPADLEAFLDSRHPTGVRRVRQHAHERSHRHRPDHRRGGPRAGPPCARLPRLGGPGPGGGLGRLLRRRRRQPPVPVPPGRGRRTPRRRRHHDHRRPSRCTPGGGTPVRGPAALGGPRGRPGHRRGTRRPDPDLRVAVSRTQDGPDP